MGGVEEYLSVATVARLCRVPDRTVRGWCESGRIPGEQDHYNAHWRIPLSAVRALLEERRKRLLAELAALDENGRETVCDDAE
jgi:excisionase family DNA binding protein